ncbi:uncharacterized protein METZ01_LOCUS383817, partial [marine metagenome]
VRTPNGNDYGKDLLRQHREKAAHADRQPSGFLRAISSFPGFQSQPDRQVWHRLYRRFRAAGNPA